MACNTGASHTITLSNEGIVYSFGRNNCGQLGLGFNYGITPKSHFKSSQNKAGFMWRIFYSLCR